MRKPSNFLQCLGYKFYKFRTGQTRISAINNLNELINRTNNIYEFYNIIKDKCYKEAARGGEICAKPHCWFVDAYYTLEKINTIVLKYCLDELKKSDNIDNVNNSIIEIIDILDRFMFLIKAEYADYIFFENIKYRKQYQHTENILERDFSTCYDEARWLNKITDVMYYDIKEIYNEMIDKKENKK